MLKKTKEEVNWQNLPKDFDVKDWEGFVYLIVNKKTNQRYVGRKYFWSKTSKRIVGRKTKKWTKKESNWRYYYSSCVELKKAVDELGLKEFDFLILSLHKTQGQANFNEVKTQFVKNVLHSKLDNGEHLYYNDNILGKYYRTNTVGDCLFLEDK